MALMRTVLPGCIGAGQTGCRWFRAGSRERRKLLDTPAAVSYGWGMEVEDEVHLGSPLAPGDSVAIMRTPEGHALLAPRSIRNLKGEALEVVADLQATVGRIQQDRARMLSLMAEARSLGVSYSAIGWSAGLSEARVRGLLKP